MCSVKQKLLGLPVFRQARLYFNLFKKQPAAHAGGTDLSRCSSTSRQNPPIQQNHRNFWPNKGILFKTWNIWKDVNKVCFMTEINYFNQIGHDGAEKIFSLKDCSMNESVTEVLVEEPLASPGSAYNYLYLINKTRLTPIEALLICQIYRWTLEKTKILSDSFSNRNSIKVNDSGVEAYDISFFFFFILIAKYNSVQDRVKMPFLAHCFISLQNI